MSKLHRSVQENLFGNSEKEELRQRIQELDQQISQSLKTNDYTKAKKLTDKQAELLQVLVELAESEP